MRLTQAGADLTGATYGAFVGTALGGPVGAAVGAAVGGLFGATAKEFIHRMLSHREVIRVGAAIHYATEVCKERVAAVHTVRDDPEFFEAAPRGLSTYLSRLGLGRSGPGARRMAPI